MKIIQSQENQYIKLVKLLKNKKYREKYSLFFDEGIKNIDLSLDSNYDINFVLIKEDFQDEYLIEKLKSKLKEDNIHHVKNNLFDNIADTVNSQGIIAVYEKRKFKDDYLSKNILIIDKVQDPGNLGTIIRTAEAKGMDTIYYTKGTVDFYSPKVVRATMGSIYFIKILMAEDINIIKQNGYKLYASSLENSVNSANAFTDDKIALIIGNEANGISREVLDLADKKVKISMCGKAESLNVAVATGMLIYEMTR